MTAFQPLPCTAPLTVASAEQKLSLVGIRPLCLACLQCVICHMLGLLVPSWLCAVSGCPSQNAREKSTSSHDLIRCHSPLSTSQVPEDTNGHPTLLCVHFIWKSWHDLRSCVKKHLSVVRLQEIFTDTLLLWQETLSFHKSQGLQTLRGHVRGVFPLSLHYLERVNHAEEGKGMKLRSSFDKSEKRRLCVCQKPEIALKLRKEQLVENLANSQLCETFKSEWWTVLGVLHLEWRKSTLFRSSVLYCWSSEYNRHDSCLRRPTHIMTLYKTADAFLKKRIWGTFVISKSAPLTRHLTSKVPPNRHVYKDTILSSL